MLFIISLRLVISFLTPSTIFIMFTGQFPLGETENRASMYFHSYIFVPFSYVVLTINMNQLPSRKTFAGVAANVSGTWAFLLRAGLELRRPVVSHESRQQRTAKLPSAGVSAPLGLDRRWVGVSSSQSSDLRNSCDLSDSQNLTNVHKAMVKIDKNKQTRVLRKYD